MLNGCRSNKCWESSFVNAAGIGCCTLCSFCALDAVRHTLVELGCVSPFLPAATPTSAHWSSLFLGGQLDADLRVANRSLAEPAPVRQMSPLPAEAPSKL